MGWRPKKLTREQMEERRIQGGRLLIEGQLTQAEIARELGVSRMAVSQWAKRIKSTQSLSSSQASGQPPKLTPIEQKQLKRLLVRGAQAAGFASERWTLKRIRQVIGKQFGVTYHMSSVARLMKRMELTPQQPLARALERNEVVISAWRSRDWNRIKKSQTTGSNHRVS